MPTAPALESTHAPHPDTRHPAQRRGITPTGAVALGAFGYFASYACAGIVVVLVDGAEGAQDLSQWGLLSGLGAQWFVMLLTVVFASRVFGTGNVRRDVGLDFGRKDWLFGMLAIPAAFLLQISLPVLYLPLQHFWPDVFSLEKLSERSRDIIGEPGGPAFWLIVIAVAVGAPLVEEIFFRGLLQRPFDGPRSKWVAWVVVSIVFAAVHFAPIEFPGLLLAGLLFGAGLLWSRRIAWGLFAHFAFNLTAAISLVVYAYN